MEWKGRDERKFGDIAVPVFRLSQTLPKSLDPRPGNPEAPEADSQPFTHYPEAKVHRLVICNIHHRSWLSPPANISMWFI